MHGLKGKKVLYIGQSFFGYEKEIKRMLENMGATVDYYNERPSNNILTKTLIRLRLKKILHIKIQNYYNKIINETKNTEYDYVFLVKIETIDKPILEKIKNSQKNAEFMLYMWDSVRNYKSSVETLALFDRAFSFDKQDCIAYNKLQFLALFYIPIYENIEKKEIVYDLCFIGSGHSDRYVIVKNIFNQVEKLGLRMFTFFFLHTKQMYRFRKLFDKKFKNAVIGEFSFEPMSQQDVVEVIARSNVIVDIEHPQQSGLTMRTIEMLGAQKKLITTNADIKNYDFYNENNVYVIDRNSPNLKKEFFDSPYLSIEPEIYEKYALRSWIGSIFNMEKL